MKIAMIGHKRIPSREGGVEVVVESLAVRMAKSGHDVTAYNRRGKHVALGKRIDIKEYEGVRIKNIPTFENGKLNAVVYSVLASAAALFGRYDVIHFHAEGPCSMLWLPHLFGVRTVATIHGLDWRRAKWGGFATRFLKFGEKTAAKYADKIIVLSEGTKRYFAETYARETVFLPNGTEVCDYEPPDVIREKYGLSKDGYILFLARIVPEKGLHYLLDAFADIDTDIKLVVAGAASHTEEYARAVKEKASSDSRVIFTGYVEGKELWELYHNCRAYVLPSDVEGMPLTLLEAMACGCECLVSDIETITGAGGPYVRTFRRADTRDLKEKLNDILSAPKSDKTEQIEYIKRNYSWDRITEKTVELYRE